MRYLIIGFLLVSTSFGQTVGQGDRGSISGTVTSKRGTASVITGYLSVEKFSFTINILLEGSPADVVFSGTFDGTTLKGNISVQGFSLDFTGVKPTSTSTAVASVLGGAQ